MNTVPSYRIGNDLPISFAVENIDTAQTTDITLYDPYGYPVEMSWDTNDTEVTGIFLGKDQKRTGLYTVKVVINKGLPGMVTRDMQLFRLVAHSWEADTEVPVPEGDSSEDSEEDREEDGSGSWDDESEGGSESSEDGSEDSSEDGSGSEDDGKGDGGE